MLKSHMQANHKPYRVAVIADIHGTLSSLQAVLKDIQTVNPDEIVVAGDFLGGPQPGDVLNALLEHQSRFILGNGEMNMLIMHKGTAPQEWWTHRQFDLVRWIYNQLDDAVFDFLENLPEQIVIHPKGCVPFRVVHGAPWDINKLVFPDREPEVLDRALDMIPEEVLVFAHTHLPAIIRRKGKLAVNPGAVGNNLNGDTRASYATLDWEGSCWQPELHYVPYDLDEVVEDFRSSGFLEATRPLGRAFLESILTGDNTGWDFILFAFNLAKEAGYKGLTVVPDDIWFAAEASFPWRFSF